MKENIKGNTIYVYLFRRKAIKQYLSNIRSKKVVRNKEFWKTIKPFLTNKGCLENNDIMIINDNDMVTDDKTLAKTFSEHYINTVERSSDLKPEKWNLKIHLIPAEIFYIVL